MTTTTRTEPNPTDCAYCGRTFDAAAEPENSPIVDGVHWCGYCDSVHACCDCGKQRYRDDMSYSSVMGEWACDECNDTTRRSEEAAARREMDARSFDYQQYRLNGSAI